MAASAAARKTVTILFCDLVGSTTLGEALDAEPLRNVLGRWHDAMRAPVERHGGTVEKFIGDAVMAVFGVPHVHEDDALRAVQSAVQMREGLKHLNDELASEGRPPLGIRVGITSGEVVAGAGAETLVTGDAVNTAKRLEEAARTNEILIGEPTRLLVEHAVLLEPADAVEAKGKSQPVDAWRVLAAIAGAGSFARRLDAPLIGRIEELALLEAELDAAVRERACRVVTVYGDAGIGKSRLAAELATRARERVRVLSARCVPYGDGITFLPLRDLVRSAGGHDAVRASVAGEPDGDLVADRLEDTGASAEETMWAVRRLLETLARKRPLLVWLEDVHWAAPTFLDLLEYVAAWSQDAPITLLCLARPELLDARPRWPGASLVLEPLDPTEAEALLDALDAEWPLTPELRSQVAEAAEGNPLFVEQMVAMLSDAGTTGVTVPPTIQALLSARLDRLESVERSVLERAAVAGREFSRAAIAVLSPPDEQTELGTTLLSLVRRELLRPGRAREPGIDALRFGHALIRDAAYAAIPKTSRAALHARFADWLASNGKEDELVAYHLEQAYHCTVDVGAPDATLGERAARLLAGAGSRAHGRDDMPAAANLLERALALADLGADRGELLRELASARWRLGNPGAADTLADAICHAEAAGDVRLEWLCRLEGAARRNIIRGGDDDLEAVATHAIEVFEELGDDAGLARAWRRLALASLGEWRYGDAAAQAERALEHAARAGDHSDDVALADTYCTALLYGPAPADDAARRCRELLERFGDDRMARAVIVSSLGGLEAMAGSFGAARALAREAASLFDELGARMTRAGLAEVNAEIERLAGDLQAAERELRLGRAIFEEAGSEAGAGLFAASLVGVLVEQERIDEAELMLADALASIRLEDVDGYVAAQLARARLAVTRGHADEARKLADDALAGLRGTDAITIKAEVLAVRAAAAGDPPDDAIAVYEQKGNVAAAAKLRDLVKAQAAR